MSHDKHNILLVPGSSRVGKTIPLHNLSANFFLLDPHEELAAKIRVVNRRRLRRKRRRRLAARKKK